MPGTICTVTVAAPTTALTTLVNAKAELALTATTDDAYITSLIARASGIIARHCGRTFGYQTLVEVFRFGWQPGVGPSSQQVAPYGTPLQTAYKPLVTTFVPVVPASEAITENGTLLTRGTDYECDYPAGLLWRLRAGLRSWWGVPEVDATYISGYVLPNDSTPASPVPDPLPSDIESVCLAMVAAGYTGRGRDPTVQIDLTEGVGRVVYQRTSGIANMAIDAGLAALLSPHRRQAW